MELPYQFRKAVARRTVDTRYDVIQLSQPHAYLAALDHQRSGRPGIFVNRSHGLELRFTEVMNTWHEKLGMTCRFPKSLLSAALARLLNRHWSLMSRAADGIILTCREDRRFLLDHTDVEPDRVRAIHHGVPDGYLLRGPAEMRGERLRRLLYVGQFSFFKGPDILARAVSRLLARNTGVSFTWVCSSKDHQQACSLFEPSILPRVRFLGWRPREELVELYDSHGVFLFPSLFEGAGKVSLEAMSRGMCVVASETGAMMDYIRSRQNGVLVPTGQVERIVNSVESLIRAPSACRRISRLARASAARYTWRRCAEQAVEFYRALQARKAVAGSPLNSTHSAAGMPLTTAAGR